MLKIWGRKNSINVQKVLWCCAELNIEYERIDAGMQFGVNNTPEYLAMNPNGLVPTINHDGFVLWESHAILRYLCGISGLGTLWPGTPRAFANADRWLEWYNTTLWINLRPVFWNLVRVAPEKRDMPLVDESVKKLNANWQIADAHLSGSRYFGGENFTMGDIPLVQPAGGARTARESGSLVPRDLRAAGIPEALHGAADIIACLATGEQADR